MATDGPPCPSEIAAQLQRFVDAVQVLVIVAERLARDREASAAIGAEARQAAGDVLEAAVELQRSWRRVAVEAPARRPRPN